MSVVWNNYRAYVLAQDEAGCARAVCARARLDGGLDLSAGDGGAHLGLAARHHRHGQRLPRQRSLIQNKNWGPENCQTEDRGPREAPETCWQTEIKLHSIMVLKFFTSQKGHVERPS